MVCAVLPVAAVAVPVSIDLCVAPATLFVVPMESRIISVADIDRDGVHIDVARGSAYDAYLSRR